MKRALLASLFVGSALLMANPAAQQNQANASQTTQVSEKEAQQFTVALVKIEKLRQSFQQQIQAATPKGERPSQEAVKQANVDFQDKAVSIVKEQGLTLQKYNTYAQLLQKDKGFQQKIKQNLQSMNQ